jgi:hypothetical protein
VGERMSFKATRVETHLNAPPTTTKHAKFRKMLLGDATKLFFSTLAGAIGFQSSKVSFVSKILHALL